jgi:PAS domain S-box-containing protein
MTTEKNRQQLEQELKAVRAELAALREVEAKRDAIEDVLRGLEIGLDTMQLGVTITDVGGRIVYVNEADAKMHNRSVDELMGRDVGILAPAGRRKPLTVQQLRDLSSWMRRHQRAEIRRRGLTAVGSRVQRPRRTRYLRNLAINSRRQVRRSQPGAGEDTRPRID